MFGLSGEKILLLGLLAVLILGPERLPGYAQTLAEWIKKLKRMVDNYQKQAKDELGAGFEDLDWKKLDPRQYDPRRIVKDALREELSPFTAAVSTAAAVTPLAKGEKPPFDIEAT